MTRARLLRYSASAAVVLALAWLALRPAPVPVDTVLADTGAVVDSVEAEGRTRLLDRYLITAPIAAQARRQGLEVGDPVAVDQVLVVLDPLPAPALDPRSRAEATATAEAADSQLRGAGEDLAAADAAAAQAASELARLESLGERDLVAREAVERARTLQQRTAREAASARFRQATARHQLEAARAALALGSRARSDEPALELTAPVAGVVLRRYHESSRPVQAGEPLLEIGDPAAMEIEVDVLSADAVRLRDGMPVQLFRWGEDAPLDGRVRRVEPAGFTKVSALGVEEQRVLVLLQFSGEPGKWARLGPGYRVWGRVVLRQEADAVKAPLGALVREGRRWAVFRVADGRARLTSVDVGAMTDDEAEIRKGLKPGDRVVVFPSDKVSDGVRIRERGR